MRTVRLATFGCVLALSGAVACAHQEPPKELTSARQAYQRVAAGPAATKAPAELNEARKALDVAERAYADDPKSQDARDYAYIAQREALLAGVRGNIQVAREAKALAEQRSKTQTQEQLQAAREALQKHEQSQKTAEQQLAEERQARAEAEKMAAERQKEMEELSKIAKVQQDARGTIVSIPGGIAFATGKAVILAGAQDRLDRIAKALAGSNRKMTVEGHTDSTGSAEKNQILSEQRANAVRDYLISRGVRADLLTAVGYGATRPVADNATAAGRAQNRRVEVVISEEPTT